MRRWLAALAFVAAPLACNAILGAGDPTPAGSGGASSSSSSASAGGGGSSSVTTSSTSSSMATGSGGGTNPLCGHGETCILVGPGVAVAKASEENCPHAVQQYIACNPTHCGCPEVFNGGETCSPVVTVPCSPDAGVEVKDDRCVTLPTSAKAIEVRSGKGVECGTPTSMIPQPFRADTKSLCSLDPPHCGAHGVCLPDDACVVVPPDAPCPAGLVSRTEIATDFDDPHGQCNCACAPCGDSSLQAFASNDCTGPYEEVAAADGCVGTGTLASVKLVISDAYCTKSASPLNSNQVLCCRPD